MLFDVQGQLYEVLEGILQEIGVGQALSIVEPEEVGETLNGPHPEQRVGGQPLVIPQQNEEGQYLVGVLGQSIQEQELDESLYVQVHPLGIGLHHRMHEEVHHLGLVEGGRVVEDEHIEQHLHSYD